MNEPLFIWAGASGGSYRSMARAYEVFFLLFIRKLKLAIFPIHQSLTEDCLVPPLDASATAHTYWLDKELVGTCFSSPRHALWSMLLSHGNDRLPHASYCHYSVDYNIDTAIQFWLFLFSSRLRRYCRRWKASPSSMAEPNHQLGPYFAYREIVFWPFISQVVWLRYFIISSQRPAK